MNKQLRDEWVKALRSGKYAQTHTRLKVVDDDDNASYCCLGVLCEVAGKEIPRYSETLDKIPQLIEVRDSAGLGEFDELGRSLQWKLANLNDDGGLTFPEIADWIEANVPVSP